MAPAHAERLYDARTESGMFSNLVTSPLVGQQVGAMTVQDVAPVLGSSGNGAASFDTAQQTAAMPVAMATFKPFGYRPVRDLRLQVSRFGS